MTERNPPKREDKYTHKEGKNLSEKEIEKEKRTPSQI